MRLMEIGGDGAELAASAADKNNTPVVERHLLSCCLQVHGDGNAGLDEAAEIVDHDDFSIPGYRLIFQTLTAIRSEGRVVTLVDVHERVVHETNRIPGLLGAVGDLGGIRGLPVWLADTLDLEPVGTRARYFALAVREASLFRRLRGAAAEISILADRPTGAAADVLAECEQTLFALGDVARKQDEDQTVVAEKLIVESQNRVDARQGGESLGGVSLGLCDLDRVLGGLRGGQMMVLGGRPGGGKTALALTIAARAAQRGLPTLFFSLEMPGDQIGDRLLAMGSGVPMSRLTRGGRLTEQEVSRVTSVGPRWQGSPLYVDDTSDQAVARMASKLRRGIRRNGIGLVVIDYLQLVRPENPRDNRVQQVGTIARRVKGMARDHGVPVVCLCQLNRSAEQRNDKPKLSDLRESGEIEQHADMVVLLHHDEQPYDAAVWKIEALVRKNRNGPVDEVDLSYVRAVMTFNNYAPETR
jgi:replicative DNA helicase